MRALLLVVINYNQFWQPLLQFASKMGLRSQLVEPNWVSENDIRGFLRLAGFRMVRMHRLLLLPKWIPLVSAFLNGFLARLSGIRRHCMMQVIVARQEIVRLDLIKMDVDGHELPVLQGGRETLRRFQPLLVMEMSPYVHAEQHQSFGDFVELLMNASYSLRNTDSGKAVPLDAAELQRLIPDGASINVVARAKARTTPP